MQVKVTAVDLDGADSVGYHVNAEGVLEKVSLSYGEALAMQKEFQRGAEWVGYESKPGKDTTASNT